MQHRPRKRFGQNFLQNQFVIEKIIREINPQKADRMIEIGPGLGALTSKLLPHLDHLIGIEIDRDLQASLQAMPEAMNKLQLINADALTIDYRQLGSHLRVVGNLPYNISTPLLLHLLEDIDCIEDMHFMLQKEVVMRLAASPGNKDYGRLTIMVQYRCEVEYLFTVSPDAFYPPPKVDSAIVRIIPHSKTSPLPVAPEQLSRLVQKAFSMRRKTLLNNLKPWFSAENLISLNINPQARPETITIDEYVRLALSLQNQQYEE